MESSKDEATHYTLVGSQLDIAPPAYTGLPVRTETTLSAQAPVGARLRWRLRFSPQPEALALRLGLPWGYGIALDGSATPDAGQGIGAVKAVVPAADLVARFKREYAEARARICAG